MREQKRFQVVMRGYDRAQVDSYLAELRRWAEMAWRRVEALEARLSELDVNPDAARRDREEANQLLERAEAKKAEAQRIAAEIVEAAHAQAQEISGAGGHDRETAAESKFKRAQIDLDELTHRLLDGRGGN